MVARFDVSLLVVVARHALDEDRDDAAALHSFGTEFEVLEPHGFPLVRNVTACVKLRNSEFFSMPVCR